MSVAELICQYCAHRNPGNPAQCAHCGAPLSAGRALASMAGHLVRAEQVVAGAAKAVAATEHAAAGAEKAVAEQYPRWQWRAAIGAIVTVAVVFGFTIMRSCSTPLASMPDLDIDQALPGQLRSAVSCQRVDTTAENCVIRADNPMLAGGLTGGRELTLSVALDPPDRRAETMRAWRAAGGAVLADGVVFVAISPSATLRYANTLVGLRVETGAFIGRAAAQTFMTRAGLTP